MGHAASTVVPEPPPADVRDALKSLGWLSPECVAEVDERINRIQALAEQLVGEVTTLRDRAEKAEAELTEARAEIARAAQEHAMRALLNRAHEELAEARAERDAEALQSDSIVASCNCGTKTNEAKHHAPGCKYRLIVERDEARAEMAAAYDWKDQMIAVESLWDVQSIGRKLGLPFGASIREATEPAIDELTHLRALRASLTKLADELRPLPRVGPRIVDEMDRMLKEAAQ